MEWGLCVVLSLSVVRKKKNPIFIFLLSISSSYFVWSFVRNLQKKILESNILDIKIA